jgi:hypothetical protein
MLKSEIRNPHSEIAMVYSFLERLHTLLTKGLSGKAYITIGASRPPDSNLPHVHLRVGKLYWGQGMLDRPTRSNTETEPLLSVHRPFEQVAWIDIAAAEPSLVANTTALVTTVCLTELDETIQTYNQDNLVKWTEAYQSVCFVKTVQWLSHKPNIEAKSLKFKVLGDFKAMKRITESEDLIQTVLLNEA